MLRSLLLVLGAVALVGVMMLSGWALTDGSRDVPPRQAAPTDGFAGEDASGAAERAGKLPPQAGEGATPPAEQQDAVREDVRARDVARRAQQRSSLSRAAGAAGPAPVRRSAGPHAPSLRPAADDAVERQRTDEAARLADRQRAEQRARDQLARRAEAAARAKEAEQAADRARINAGDGEPEAD
ncbi:MAG: hypothetical protein QOH83_2618 [Solirubrobacteraceae bacterium]|nr:hypothetical protein [Solirubrobacteraceae bacterium]